MNINITNDNSIPFPWMINLNTTLITRGPSREWCVRYLFDNYFRPGRVNVSVIDDDTLLVRGETEVIVDFKPKTPKFKIGDKVTRRRDVHDPYSPWMLGVVTRAYSDYMSRFGPYPELYEVEWNCGKVEKGFLPHGLDAEKE